MGGTPFRLWLAGAPFGGARIADCPKLLTLFGALGPGRGASSRQGVVPSPGRTIGDGPPRPSKDGRGGCARIALEKGVSHAEWQSRTSAVGSATERDVCSQGGEAGGAGPAGAS